MNAETKIEKDSNLAIWNAVSKTDPRHTKKVNQRGGFTAISAHYQVMEATRQFGPVGIGWGYHNDRPIIGDGLVIVPVTIWHGDRGNSFGPIFGGADLFDSRGKVDSDAAKKAATDGLTKGLSQLGFNADVFLGRFDDNKYVEQVQKEFEAADQQETREKVVGIHKIKERLSAMMKAGEQVKDLEQFRKLVHENKADIKTIRDANHEWWTGDGGDEFEGFGKWMERRYAELTPKEASLEFQMLVSCVNECTSGNDLRGFLNKHGDAVALLDGEESREFERIYDERTEALKLVDAASV
jgi:hypothetical protein